MNFMKGLQVFVAWLFLVGGIAWTRAAFIHYYIISIKNNNLLWKESWAQPMTNDKVYLLGLVTGVIGIWLALWAMGSITIGGKGCEKDTL